MVTLNRNYFTELYHFVNTDPQYNREDYDVVEKNLVSQKSPQWETIKNIYSKFRLDGFSLIEFMDPMNYQDALEWSSEIIGLPVTDSSNSEKTYSKIIAEKEAIYFANTHHTQPLHTDDAHVPNTPRVIALFCEKQAKKGGITTLAKFSNIYDQLKIEIQELGEALYSDNIIELEG